MSMGPEEAGKLVKALGLPDNVIWFEMRGGVNECVTIKCEYYPDINTSQSVFGEFELVSKGD